MMNKKIMITSTEIRQEEIYLLSESHFDIIALKPMEQMLVDSDNLSFIYIMDDESDYTYISIPSFVWPELRKALEKNLKVFLENQGSRVCLPNFLEELQYLIENIKGNSNYGAQMVENVEKNFD